MNTSKLVVILEKVRDELGVETGDQKKPAQANKASTSAAKAKLKELEAKLKNGRHAGNELKATGAGK